MTSDTTMPAPRSLTAIIAATTSNGIGKNGTLPWRLPGEMKYFARVTTGENAFPPNAVIMGRKTWESIPPKFRPLKGRQNVVVSRQDLHLDEEMTLTAKSLESALDNTKAASRAFLIGGAQLYDLALVPSSSQPSSIPLADRILLTRILHPDFDCDTFLTDFAALTLDGEPIWTQSSHQDLCDWLGWSAPEGEIEEKGVRYRYEMWIRR